MTEFKVGQRVRHTDGTLGRVVAINHGMVEWKSRHNWRVSDQKALTDADNEQLPRWRTKWPT